MFTVLCFDYNILTLQSLLEVVPPLKVQTAQLEVPHQSSAAMTPPKSTQRKPVVRGSRPKNTTAKSQVGPSKASAANKGTNSRLGPHNIKKELSNKLARIESLVSARTVKEDL